MKRIKRGVHGFNWCRKEKRLAIYMRDGMACCWCGAGVEDGAVLSLDHIKVYSNGGGSDADNLITSCMSCNSSRGTRSVTQFAKVVAAYLNHGIRATAILAHINTTRYRALDKKAALAILARRGGFKVAVLRATKMAA